MVTEVQRRLPVGAEVQATGTVHFRVWAPLCQKVQVVVEGGASDSADPQGNFELVRDANGFWSGLVAAAGICVILDVVYNHLCPDGNYLLKFSDAYFADHRTMSSQP